VGTAMPEDWPVATTVPAWGHRRGALLAGETVRQLRSFVSDRAVDLGLRETAGPAQVGAFDVGAIEMR
jgi:hypothetical protein